MQYLTGNDFQSFDTQFARLYGEQYSSTKGPIIKTITFVVTENCSLRCTYCYQCDKDLGKRMAKETAKAAIDMMLNDDKLNGYMDSKIHPGLILEFIGGEPFLEIDLIDYAVDYFRLQAMLLNHPWRNHYMINITTNGMHYLEPKVQAFIAKNKPRLSITITIDGDKDLHDACRIDPQGNGSYDRVVEAVKLHVTQFDRPSTKVTLAPENISFISKSIPHLFELGFEALHANVVFENVWVPKRDAPIFYSELVKLADYIIDNDLYTKYWCSIFSESIGASLSEEDNKNWCGGDGQMLAVGTDGRLFPCIRYMKYSLVSAPEISIGDVWNGIAPKEQQQELKCLSCITRRSQSTDECWNCPVAQGCAWCTAYNYDVYGTANKRATFICWLHKARVLASSYFWNKLYNKLGMSKQFELNLNDEEVALIKGEKEWI